MNPTSSGTSSLTATATTPTPVKKIKTRRVEVCLNGLCVFCLQPEDSLNPYKITPQAFTTILPDLQPKWKDNSTEYLFFIRKSKGGRGCKQYTNLPPMCNSCQLQIAQMSCCHKAIAQLKLQLVSLERKMEEFAQLMREKMKPEDDTNTNNSDQDVCIVESESYLERYKILMQRLKKKAGNSTELIISNTVQYLNELRGESLNINFDEEYLSSSRLSLEKKLDKTPKNLSVKEEYKPIIYDSEINELESMILATSVKAEIDSDNNGTEDETSEPYGAGVEEVCSDFDNVAASPSESMKEEPDFSDGDDDGDEDADTSSDEEDAPKVKRLRPDPDSTVAVGAPKRRSKRVFVNGKRITIGPGMTVPCEVCSVRFPIKSIYEHMRTHLGDNVFKCPNPDCPRAFISRWSANCMRHLKKSNENCGCDEKMLSCQKKVCECCGEEFKHLLKFGTHLSRHETQDKNHSCPIDGCEEGFTHRQTLEYHLRFHASGYGYLDKKDLQICPVCNKMNKRFAPQELERHLKEKHEAQDIIKCRHCTSIFSKAEDLVMHIIIIHYLRERMDNLSCHICEENQAEEIYRFPHSGGRFKIRDHYYEAHGIGTKIFCDWEGCEYSTFSKATLQQHVRILHTSEFPFSCEGCNPPVSFKAEDQLKSHNIDLHGADPYPCRFCDKKFNSSAKVKSHERATHNDKQDFTCEICQKTWKCTRLLYDAHVSRHNQGRLQCSFCDKTYRNRSSLSDHENYHHLGQQNKYLCNECGLALRNPDLLKQHQRIHTGERPFACEICPLRFRQKQTLRTHMKSHETRGKNFKSTGTFDRVGGHKTKKKIV